jgi:hypothetical protein
MPLTSQGVEPYEFRCDLAARQRLGKRRARLAPDNDMQFESFEAKPIGEVSAPADKGLLHSAG